MGFDELDIRMKTAETVRKLLEERRAECIGHLRQLRKVAQINGYYSNHWCETKPSVN